MYLIRRLLDAQSPTREVSVAEDVAVRSFYNGFQEGEDGLTHTVADDYGGKLDGLAAEAAAAAAALDALGPKRSIRDLLDRSTFEHQASTDGMSPMHMPYC
jgi:hypothetical protein